MSDTICFPGMAWTFDGREPWALAEAVGHAWVQQQTGCGSVNIVGADLTHPWWPVLRAWLPAAAPLRLTPVSGEVTCDSLPQRPFPPIHLASLLRSGASPWLPDSTADAALAWLAAREPAVLLAHDPAHPALAVALGAIASWGCRVCWRVPDISGLEAALDYIGQRQLPLHLIVDHVPQVLPERWLVVSHEELGLWLQHEWPTVYVPG